MECLINGVYLMNICWIELRLIIANIECNYFVPGIALRTSQVLIHLTLPAIYSNYTNQKNSNEVKYQVCSSWWEVKIWASVFYVCVCVLYKNVYSVMWFGCLSICPSYCFMEIYLILFNCCIVFRSMDGNMFFIHFPDDGHLGYFLFSAI